jgi:hypothetical protein
MESQLPSAMHNLTYTSRRLVDLFTVSFVLMFFELAAIRWFAAQVLFLTFFTNLVLLACFFGISLGCLAANSCRNLVRWTPSLLLLGIAAASALEAARSQYSKVVDLGGQASPQMVFFGAEGDAADLGSFVIPMEFVNAAFFFLIVVTFVGPGQELGRALNRIPTPLAGYSLNVFGNCIAIVTFFAFSLLELSPFWWFLLVALGLAYFVIMLDGPRHMAINCLFLTPLLFALFLTSTTTGDYQDGPRRGKHYWSPYYRIDFDQSPTPRISVNQIRHQRMISTDQRNRTFATPSYAYSLPYLLRRDSGSAPMEDVLIIGAGAGNDVSRALLWGAKRVDAVEIDPTILRLGTDHHPDLPYLDNRVTVHINDGRTFLRSSQKKYDLVIYALVDSLALHSGYSNNRLESYLFTREAFVDVSRTMKPGAWFIVYNYFRQNWITKRIHNGLEETMQHDPLLFTLPFEEKIDSAKAFSGFTMFIAGDTGALEKAFGKAHSYWLSDEQPLGPGSPNGFMPRPRTTDRDTWHQVGPAQLIGPSDIPDASDDWPFLYLRRPMIPDLYLNQIVLISAIAFLLFLSLKPATPASESRSANCLMFFSGSAFMLIETRAVVTMALLFGSTWIVSAVVLLAILITVLLANLFVVCIRPQRLWPYFGAVLATGVMTFMCPPDSLWGANGLTSTIIALVTNFTPVFFAGIIFARVFSELHVPASAIGFNVTGAMAGGLMENASMILGFRRLVLLVIALYLISGICYYYLCMRKQMKLDVKKPGFRL